MKRIAGLIATLSLGTMVVWGCNESEPVDTGCEPRLGSSHEPYSVITTFAGNGVQGEGADGLCPLKTALYWPQDMAFSPEGKPYIVDWNNYRIRVIENGLMHTVIGSGKPVPQDGEGAAPSGPARDVDLNHPTHINFDSSGNIILSGFHSSALFLCNLSTNMVAPICGNGVRCYGGDGGPDSAAIVNLPVCSHFDSQGNLYFSDQGNQRIRKIDPAGIVTTYAGSAQPPAPGGCVIPGRFSGDGGPPELAEFNFPVGQQANPSAKFCIGPDDRMYIADTGNQRIRMIANGTITTIAGNGEQGYGGDGGPATNARLNFPNSVALDPEGNLYISDYLNNAVRKVDMTTGIITTFAGHPPKEPCTEPDCSNTALDLQQWCPRGDCTDVTSFTSEELGDGGDPKDAYLHNPAGLTFDAAGNLYIADRANNRIRVILKNP